MWKIIIIASFVIGISCSWELSDQQKTSLHQVAERICSKDDGVFSFLSLFRKSKPTQVQEAVYNFMDCYDTYAQKITPHYMNGVLTSGIDMRSYDLSTRICMQRQDMNRCFYKLLDDMAICRNEGEIKKAEKLLDKLFESLCSNNTDRERIKPVDDTSLSLLCLDARSEGLKECLNKVVFDSTNLSDPIANLKKKCAPYDEILKCHYNVLTSCGKPDTVHFIADVMDLICKASPCNL